MTLQELLSNAQAYQVFLNTAAEQFDTPLWSRYMVEKYVNSLSWKALQGTVREVAAGTIKDFSSGKPVKTRPTLGQATGDIPSMGDQWQMTPKQLRDMLDIANTANFVGANQTQVLLDYLFPEVRKAALSPQKRLDWILLQSISTGGVIVNTTSNPDGVVWTIDWGITPTHVSVAAWAVGTTTSVPITDFRAILETRRAAGIPTAAIAMNWNTWNKMVSSSQILSNLGIRIQTGNKLIVASAVNTVTVDMLNIYFDSIGLPSVIIIDAPIRIESSKGTTTAVQGFADDRVAFLPSLELGELQWTYANEQRIPDKIKTYGTVNNVLVAQYLKESNFYTEYEFNAFPVLNAAAEISIMHTDATS